MALGTLNESGKSYLSVLCSTASRYYRHTDEDVSFLIGLLLQTDSESLWNSLATAVMNILHNRPRFQPLPYNIKLAWRPFYELALSIYSHQPSVMPHPRLVTGSNFVFVMELLSKYFDEAATAELLAELRPDCYPLHAGYARSVGLLNLLLPYRRPAQVLLWLPWAMQEKDRLQQSVDFLTSFMALFAGAARFSVGVIDWRPYLPGLFHRFIQHMDLPTAGNVKVKLSKRALF